LRLEFHSNYAAGGAAHRARFFFFKANRLSLARREHDLLIAVGDSHIDQRVAVFEIDRDDSGRANIFVFVERGFLHAAAAGREKDELAGAGEEHQAIVRRDALEMLDEIFLGGGRANLAATAALLRAVERQRSALDIAAVRDGDELILFDDEILDRELALGFDDLSAARIGEFFFDFVELARYQLQQFLLVGQNFPVAGDQLDRLLVFVFDFLALERSKAAQREIEDRLRLQLRQPELLHQAGPRALGVLRSANQLDDCVQILQRNQQAVEDVEARLGFLQLESRAARE